MNTFWKLSWTFINDHEWHKNFLTKEKAIEYSEVLDLDVDPNIRTWSLIEVPSEEGYRL
jgi:hypothetical protein